MKYIYLVTSCSDDINNIYEIYRADFGQYNFKRVFTFFKDCFFEGDDEPCADTIIANFCLENSGNCNSDDFNIIHL